MTNDNFKPERARGWVITIHESNGYTEEYIIESLKTYNYIGQKEIAPSTGSKHWHIYIEEVNPFWSTTLKEIFPLGKIEKRKGTKQQAYDYVTKSATKIPGSEISNGEINLSSKGSSKPSREDVVELIKEGNRWEDIRDQYPHLAGIDSYFEKVDAKVQKDKAFSKQRDVDVFYIYGLPGVGKTRAIYDNFGYDEVYRVTDYKHPFDDYHGEDILVFDEFDSQIPFEVMLTLVDRYPVVMPARYNNKYALFTKVIFLSNVPFENTYTEKKKWKLERWWAWERRVKNVFEMEAGGVLTQLSGDKLPFDQREKKITLRVRVLGSGGFFSGGNN